MLRWCIPVAETSTLALHQTHRQDQRGLRCPPRCAAIGAAATGAAAGASGNMHPRREHYVHAGEARRVHVAAAAGHLEVVRALMQKGADINKVDKYGMDAKTLATNAGHLAVSELIATPMRIR